MTSAGGVREVPYPRPRVWQALAVLAPYCAVCDVSYVVPGSSAIGRGTTFVCVPGHADGEPPAGSPRGEVVEWEAPRLVTTRLELTPETWTTRIELADTDDGGTRVSITLTHRPTRGSRLVHWMQRGALRRLVRETVDAELGKVEAHVRQLAGPD